MLALLKAGDPGPATVDDSLRRIHDNLRAARVEVEVGNDELRDRLANALFKLEKAKLVEGGMADSYRTTARGRRTLRDHPLGVDESVLIKYPEFADFIDKLSDRASPVEIGAVEYEQGYEAFLAGRNYLNNPYSDDSARYTAWQNGWFQAFDEHGDIEHE